MSQLVLQRDDVWFSFFVREDTLHQFKQGESYHIQIPALNMATVPATLQYLKPLPAFASHRLTADRGTIDLKTFEIRLVPEKPHDDCLATGYPLRIGSLLVRRTGVREYPFTNANIAITQPFNHRLGIAPASLQVISQFLPLTHYIDGLRRLALGAANWHSLAGSCGILLLFTLVHCLFAYIGVKKLTKES
ncbi:MAG: hypothetical protein ACOH5I_13320 [Oligoflexus sp.]